MVRNRLPVNSQGTVRLYSSFDVYLMHVTRRFLDKNKVFSLDNWYHEIVFPYMCIVQCRSNYAHESVIVSITYTVLMVPTIHGKTKLGTNNLP